VRSPRQADRGVALGLHGAGVCQRAAILGFPPPRRQDEIGGGHRRHLDMQVDAIDERAREPPLILGAQRALAPRLQANPGSLAQPQRQGFIAAPA